MQRIGLPTLFDTHVPTHGNWTGLSLGWVSTIWLSSMLSRGDHRMVHVEPRVFQRLYTLGGTTGQTVSASISPLAFLPAAFAFSVFIVAAPRK
jgi:transposase